MFCVQHVQAGLQVNFEFGQEYASEKNGIVSTNQAQSVGEFVALTRA